MAMIQKSVIIKKCGLIGSGGGLALFAVFGLLQGALIGGTAGIGIARYIFGAGTLEIMASDLLPRVVIAASMLAGVLVSCIAFVVMGGVIGAACGYALALAMGEGEAVEGNYTASEAVAKNRD